MDSRDNSLIYRVSRTSIRLTTADDVSLVGTWFLPESYHPSTAIVATCGAGIPAKFYHRMAHFLASQGAAVLTFDYRGIGESQAGSIRKIESGMECWGEFDLGAALCEASARFPDASLGVIAHSVSALLVGAAPNAGRLSRIVFFGPHTGY